jgi:farnesyl diphosphate synthase
MDFSQSLERSAQLVEARLAALLDVAGMGGAPERLVASMRHATLGGGKRFRPFLVLECAALFDVDASEAVEAAAAVECVHCYSLVHDDLPAMDNDDLRRGQPTVHRAFDEWTAILAGDALLTLAFEVLAAPATHPDVAIRAELVAGLARASGGAGMVGGQYLDLTAEKLGDPARPTPDHVRRLQAMKTGALIRFACEAGAILGRAGALERQAVATYGERLGEAFQIADDLLDIEGDAVAMGKAARKDAYKATLPAASGVAAAKQRLAVLEVEAMSALAPFGAKAAALRQATAFVVRRQS